MALDLQTQWVVNHFSDKLSNHITGLNFMTVFTIVIKQITWLLSLKPDYAIGSLGPENGKKVAKHDHEMCHWLQMLNA